MPIAHDNQDTLRESASAMLAAEYDEYGPADVLRVRRVPRPAIAPGHVLVKVHASSVNPVDAIIRSGKLRFKTGKTFPKRTGIDFAGEVVQVAPGDAGFQIGNRVWGVLLTTETGTGQGCAAEYLSVPVDRLALMPTTLDFIHAAAISGVGAVSVIALRDKAQLKRGERILVRGAAGGVGSVAVQLASTLGAHVTALASAKDLDFVRSLGAHEVFDHRKTSPASLGPFDVVLDLVGTQLGDYRKLLTRTGRMYCLSITGLGAIAYILASSVFGSKRVQFFSAAPQASTMADLTRCAESGTLRPILNRVYPLADIVEAQRSVESGAGRGKVVLDHVGQARPAA